MVNPISNVSYANPGVLDVVTQAQLASPGAYAQQPHVVVIQQRPEKSSGSIVVPLIKFIFKTAVLAAAMVGCRKFLMRNYKVVDKMPEQAKSWARFKNAFAKTADWIERNTITRFKNMKQAKAESKN